MPPTATTHCSGSQGCGRGWTGVSQAHCSICHEHFSTVENFDKHKPGPRKKDGTPTCGAPGEQTRRKKDGTVVPLLKSVSTVHGPLWVSWTPEGEEPEA